MDAYSVYRDIQKRTKGQFLIGVVGPVRTGKSTLIRRFLEVLALPYLSEKEQAEVRDALPLSGEGKTITTVEPKFVPKDAVELQLGEGDPIRLRLIDCVGFLVPDAAGNLENEKERMVKTPWSEQAIPFREAAEIGTKKVIAEHSTIGLMVTCDGSFGELPRENFLQAEERTVAELKKQGKPFLILVNAKKPYREETQREEYRKVEDAIHAVRGCGYGVVIPGREEIQLEEPAVIHQGNKYGVKIKSVSPSIHMIKANIETEIAPIVGSEQQAEDLIAYIKESAKSPEGIWNTNIFGKSVEQLVDDGIRSKIAQITEDGQAKLQDSMQKIVNDSRGGMVCIII